LIAGQIAGQIAGRITRCGHTRIVARRGMRRDMRRRTGMPGVPANR
jgi:hypothetical protein